MFEAFAIGPLLIWTRLVFLLLGIWMATEFLIRLAKRAYLPLDHFRHYAWWYFLSFLLAGRFFAIVAEYQVYWHDLLRVFVFWDGSFSLLGGIIGVSIVLFIVTWQHSTTFLQWLDVLLPATTFGLFFDWLGKFFSGNSHGSQSDLFWAVTYDNMNVRFTDSVHPVQLYFALFYILLTFFLLVIRMNAKRAGAETLWGVTLASVGTFLLEYFRGDISTLIFLNKLDLIMLMVLFVVLGIFALIELKISLMSIYVYCILICGGVVIYLAIRFLWLDYPSFSLRFSQFLAMLALLSTVVYVVVHRRQHPDL